MMRTKDCIKPKNQVQTKVSVQYAQYSQKYFNKVFSALDHWAYYSVFENGVLLMYTLEGVNSVANFITAYEESQ